MNRLVRPGRPRRRKIDVIDVGFRVSGSLGGLGVCALIVALVATSPVRSAEWVIAAVLVSVPMSVAFVFALLSWNAWVADRRVERAGRMELNFSSVSVRVEPVRDDRAAAGNR